MTSVRLVLLAAEQSHGDSSPRRAVGPARRRQHRPDDLCRGRHPHLGGTPPAGVGGGRLPGRHGVDATEVEVALRPADDRPPGLQRRARRRRASPARRAAGRRPSAGGAPRPRRGGHGPGRWPPPAPGPARVRIRLEPPLPTARAHRAVGADHQRRRHHRRHPHPGRASGGTRRGRGRPRPACCWPSRRCRGAASPTPRRWTWSCWRRCPPRRSRSRGSCPRWPGGGAARRPRAPAARTSSVATIASASATACSGDPAAAGQPGSLLELEEPERHQLATEGRRRVGEEAVPAPLHRQRRALHHLRSR